MICADHRLTWHQSRHHDSSPSQSTNRPAAMDWTAALSAAPLNARNPTSMQRAISTSKRFPGIRHLGVHAARANLQGEYGVKRDGRDIVVRVVVSGGLAARKNSHQPNSRRGKRLHLCYNASCIRSPYATPCKYTRCAGGSQTLPQRWIGICTALEGMRRRRANPTQSTHLRTIYLKSTYNDQSTTLP